MKEINLKESVIIKTLKVIDSCKTLEQLYCAQKYVWLSESKIISKKQNALIHARLTNKCAEIVFKGM